MDGEIELKTYFLGRKADMVEVVRCKDCKFWKKTIYDTPNWMPCMSVQTNGNWFCAYGEPKGGDGK